MPGNHNGGKTIVILSTEPWGRMLLSKMHYALELAGMGHDVYFVNPPRESQRHDLASISTTEKGDQVTIIDTTPVAKALFLRHKVFPVYRYWVTGRYVKAIRELIGKPIDEVWCFDPH